MAGRVYGIRRAYLVPLGVDALLLFGLVLISFLGKGEATERLVFSLFLVPTLYLFLEGLARRVTVTEAGVVIRKLWRVREVSWEKITHIGFLVLRKKVYLLLTTVKGFFIISNAYAEFPSLVEGIVSRVGREKVEDDLPLEAGRSPAGIANLVAAWFAAVFMVGIILLKLFPSVG